MINKGSPEFKRYWRAWYSLKRPGEERRQLHAAWGLPESHTTFDEPDLARWEEACRDSRRAQLRALIQIQVEGLTEEERKELSRQVRERLGNRSAGLEELSEDELRRALVLIGKR